MKKTHTAVDAVVIRIVVKGKFDSGSVYENEYLIYFNFGITLLQTTFSTNRIISDDILTKTLYLNFIPFVIFTYFILLRRV